MPDRPFFRSGVAWCRGLAAEGRIAALEAILEPDPRLDVLRVMFPVETKVAQAAADTHPGQAAAHFWLGETLQAADDLSGAISAYEAGLALDPIHGEEWDNLGRLYERQGELNRAVHAFDQACHYIDQGKNGCPNAARLYVRLGMLEQAIARYQDTLVQLPGYLPALRGLVAAYFALGRPSEAIPYLEILVAQGESNAQMLLEQLETTP